MLSETWSFAWCGHKKEVNFSGTTHLLKEIITSTWSYLKNYFLFFSECSSVASIPTLHVADMQSKSSPLQWWVWTRSGLTSAHALMTANFSIVDALSLYSWAGAPFPTCSLANEDTSSWWTRRRSFRSWATPLPIHALDTCKGTPMSDDQNLVKF